MYCAAFQVQPFQSSADIAPESVHEVMQQMFSVSSYEGVALLTIRALSAATTYDIYCATESYKGVPMSTSQMLSQVATATTSCCKGLTVTQSITSLYEGEGIQNALTITLDALPYTDLVFAIGAVSTNGVVPAAENMFYPSSIRVTNSSLSQSFSLAVTAGSAGTYQLSVTLQGGSADEFSPTFAGSKGGILTVLRSDQEPATPRLASARFADDGSSVVVTFDGPTNRGGYNNGFTCTQIFQFAGATAATCQWLDHSTVAIYLDASAPDVLVVSSNVTVMERTGIKFECSLATEVCAGWATVAAQTIPVESPSDPILPVVTLSMPSVVSACSGISIDISSSSGSGGRAWLQPRFSVIGGTGEIEELLNSESFSISPPTMIPPSLLEPGKTYTITATLCNFLEVCGKSSRAVLVSAGDELMPVISIAGQQQRTVTTAVPLVLAADAYAIDCSGSQARTGMQYSWTVYDNGVRANGLVSQSQDASKFRLAAFTLTPLHTYEIRVTVRSVQSSQTSSASVMVFVAQSPLVAQFIGGSTRSVVVGGSVLLDASSSYDADRKGLAGVSAGLVYSWSCVQVKPVFSSACALDFITILDSSSEKLSVSAGIKAINTTSTVTVTVSDATRTSSTSVDVSTQDSSAPVIAFTSTPQLLSTINVNARFELSGSVQTQSSCTSRWAVDEQSVLLADSALSPVAVQIPTASTRTVNLVLAAHTLPERASLRFSLSCASSSASIVVTTNGPPLPGMFSVSPSTGEELSTRFQFSAATWIDAHLPITYQFGFKSVTTGANLVARSRSEATFGSSTLPAGTAASSYAVSCYVEVYDSLNAYAIAWAAVTVTPVDDEEALQSSILANLAASAGNVDDTKSAISVGSSVLNSVNCTLAPACSSLNRAECGMRDHTCGACLGGYVGDAGDGNSLCIDPASRRLHGAVSIGKVHCDDSSQCSPWEVCGADRLCMLPSKTCDRACSGHGTCERVNSNTHNTVSVCLVDDPTCTARCRCSAEYVGRDCGIARSDVVRRQTVRNELISSLADITQRDDINDESVAEWVNSLSTLAQDPFEISANDIGAVQDIAQHILESVQMLSTVSYTHVATILEVLDTLEEAAAEGGVGDEVLAELTLRNGELAALFSALVTSELVAGQNTVKFLHRNYRMSAVVQYGADTDAVSVSLPRTAMESYLTAQTSSVSVPTGPNSEDKLAVSVTSASAASYGTVAATFSSNPLKLAISTTSALDGEVEVVLVNNVPMVYSNETQTFNTTCKGSADFSLHNYTCSESGELVTHRCEGKSVQLSSTCPTLQPSCSLIDSTTGALNSSSTLCRVQSFDALSTTCACTVNGGDEEGSSANVRRFRRKLQDGEFVETTTLDLVSTSTYIGSEFVETLLVADGFNSVEDLQRVLIVILMFAVLWGMGLVVIFGCTWRQQYKKKKNEKDKQVLERRKQGALLSRSPAAVREYLVNYVAEVFPSVFSNKPFFTRIVNEVKRHHRYLTLLTAPPGESGDRQRILTGVQLLSIQTMLMFLLAWLYDIQSPADDGSCENHDSESSCLARKTVLDTNQSYCQWIKSDETSSDKHMCEFAPPELNIKVVLYIAVIVALFVAICTKPIDVIFDLLSAPTADSIKVSAQDTTLTRVGRRISNAARRMSAAAVKLASAAKQRVNASRRSIVGLGTRQIPPSTESAHALAAASMQVIAKPSVVALQTNQLNRMRRFYQATHLHLQAISGGDNDDPSLSEHSSGPSRQSNASSNSSSNSSSSSGAADSDDDDSHKVGLRKAAGVGRGIGRGLVGNVATKRESDSARMEDLVKQVYSQRGLLKPAEVEEFDSQWGMDPTGEFVAPENSIVPCFPSKPGAEELIRREIKAVAALTAAKAEKLKVATDTHTGLEILHLFIMDLLGRYTPAARIFESKSETDFRHTKVVTRRTKYLAVAALAALNTFFVYFAILTGFRRGVEWQRGYLAACLVQFIVEILLFETMECVWVNCVIPALVSDEVRAVGDSIKEVVYNLSQVEPENSRFFLNAPEFLFVSTNLAKKFPQLMESILVQSYYSHVPGELAKKWQVGAVARIHRYYRLRNVTALTTILGSLQLMGTAPFIVHRMFVRFTQPIVLSALVLLIMLIVSSPVITGVVFGLLAAVLLFYLRRWWLKRSALMRERREQQQQQLKPTRGKLAVIGILDSDDECDSEEGGGSGGRSGKWSGGGSGPLLGLRGVQDQRGALHMSARVSPQPPTTGPKDGYDKHEAVQDQRGALHISARVSPQPPATSPQNGHEEKHISQEHKFADIAEEVEKGCMLVAAAGKARCARPVAHHLRAGASDSDDDSISEAISSIDVESNEDEVGCSSERTDSQDSQTAAAAAIESSGERKLETSLARKSAQRTVPLSLDSASDLPSIVAPPPPAAASSKDELETEWEEELFMAWPPQVSTPPMTPPPAGAAPGMCSSTAAAGLSSRPTPKHSRGTARADEEGTSDDGDVCVCIALHDVPVPPSSCSSVGKRSAADSVRSSNTYQQEHRPDQPSGAGAMEVVSARASEVIGLRARLSCGTDSSPENGNSEVEVSSSCVSTISDVSSFSQ